MIALAVIAMTVLTEISTTALAKAGCGGISGGCDDGHCGEHEGGHASGAFGAGNSAYTPGSTCYTQDGSYDGYHDP